MIEVDVTLDLPESLSPLETPAFHVAFGVDWPTMDWPRPERIANKSTVKETSQVGKSGTALLSIALDGVPFAIGQYTSHHYWLTVSGRMEKLQSGGSPLGGTATIRRSEIECCPCQPAR